MVTPLQPVGAVSGDKLDSIDVQDLADRTETRVRDTEVQGGPATEDGAVEEALLGELGRSPRYTFSSEKESIAVLKSGCFPFACRKVGQASLPSLRPACLFALQ